MSSKAKKYLIILLLLTQTIWATDKIRRRQELEDRQEIAKYEQQLKFYQQEYQKIKVNRWQDKRNSIARKEAFSEAWDELRREMDQLNQRKMQKESMLLRLDNQVKQMETDVQTLENRFKDFGIQLTEKGNELIKALRSGFPYENEKMITRLQALQKEIEARGYRPSSSDIHALFDLHQKRFVLGETREVIRDQMALQKVTPADPAQNLKGSVPAQAGLVAGYFFRLGMIYKGFVSTESPDAAILAKSGNLGNDAWIWLENISSEAKTELQKARQQWLLNQDSVQVPLLLPVDVILRKSTGKGYAAEQESSFWEDLKAEWMGAGFVIYFIIGIVSLSLLIVGEKFILIVFRGLGSGRIYRKVSRMLQNNQVDDAVRYLSRRSNVVAKVMFVILDKRHAQRHEAEEAAYASLLHQTPAFERNINTINILASAAPLVGLLGTVSGMINLFAAITMHGTNDPKIMAAGIAEALLSTKWGLIVALPLMLIYNMTSNMVGKVVGDLEKYSASLINQLYGTPKNHD